MITDQTSFVSKSVRETFLVVQQLRFCATNAESRFNPWSGNYIALAATKILDAKIKDPS